VKADLTSQLAATNDQLRRLQAKSRSAEMFARIKERTDAEIRKLQGDITDLKRARVAQVALMRAEKAKFTEQLASRNRDIARLHKEDAELRTELARLRAEGGKRELALRRKLEEATARAAVGSPQPSLPRVATSAGKPLAGNGSRLGPTGGRDTRLSSRNATLAAVAKSVREVKRRTEMAAGQLMPSDEEIEDTLAALAAHDAAPAPAAAGATAAGGGKGAAMPSNKSAGPSLLRAGSAGSMASGAPPAARTRGSPATPTTHAPGLHAGASPAAQLRRQLEAAVARIAEKERRVEELERRLRAREQDVKM
jgi:hypothetical protein